MPVWKAAMRTCSKIYLDKLEIQLTAFNLDGYNYFKLADIAKALDFSVTWDERANTVSIDTAKAYDAEAASGTTGD